MKNFNAFFQKIYSQPLANRQYWYAEATTAYAEQRAPYVEAVIDWIAQQIVPESPMLEIGSGPGNATQHFIKRGFQITCLEPNLEACKFATKRFHGCSNLQITNSTFEEWDPPAKKFDVVLASTSFHWLQPETRCQAIANLLTPQGKIVLLWNTAPQADPKIFQHLLPVYDRYMPGFSGFEDIDVQKRNLNDIAQSLIDSEYFENLRLTQAIGTRNYAPDAYLQLLTTLSPYISLAETVRTQLMDELKAIFLDHQIKIIPTEYLCAAHIAQVKPEHSSQ